LKNITDRISGQFVGTVHGIHAMSENLPLSERPKLINISRTQELKLDSHGNYDL